jgi:hypothetical protein
VGFAGVVVKLGGRVANTGNRAKPLNSVLKKRANSNPKRANWNELKRKKQLRNIDGEPETG